MNFAMFPRPLVHTAVRQACAQGRILNISKTLRASRAVLRHGRAVCVLAARSSQLDRIPSPLSGHSLAVRRCSNLSDASFERIVEETLESLFDRFEELPDLFPCPEDYDVSYASGVLTVTLGVDYGVYVINKQTPNKQLWLSSPVSGPKRYDFVGGRWIYKYDGICLHDLLQSEISHQLRTKVDFSCCSHSGS